MITKFKIYESTELSTISNCGYYIESNLPKKYFFNWEYDDTYDHENDTYNDDSILKNQDYITYYFYYNQDIDYETDILDEVYDFFDNYGIEAIEDYGLHSTTRKNIKTQVKITAKVPKDLVIKFSELYVKFAELHKNMNKYNL